jgi:hypothetical protein
LTRPKWSSPIRRAESDERTNLRKSISCMVAGLLLFVPIALLTYGGDTPDWAPRGIVIIALFFVMDAGALWLFDEIRGIVRRGD